MRIPILAGLAFLIATAGAFPRDTDAHDEALLTEVLKGHGLTLESVFVSKQDIGGYACPKASLVVRSVNRPVTRDRIIKVSEALRRGVSGMGFGKIYDIEVQFFSSLRPPPKVGASRNLGQQVGRGSGSRVAWYGFARLTRKLERRKRNGKSRVMGLGRTTDEAWWAPGNATKSKEHGDARPEQVE